MNEDVLREILYYVQDISNIFKINKIIYKICSDNDYWINKFTINQLPIVTYFNCLKHWQKYYKNAKQFKNYTDQIMDLLNNYKLLKNTEKANCVYFNLKDNHALNLSCFKKFELDIDEINHYLYSAIVERLKHSKHHLPILGIFYENGSYELRFTYRRNDISYDIDKEEATSIIYHLLSSGNAPCDWNSQLLKLKN